MCYSISLLYFTLLGQISETQASCKCKIFSECAWSNNTVFQLHILNPDKPIHKALSRKFQDQICNYKTRSVWCCRNGEPGTEEELEALSSKYIDYFTLDYALFPKITKRHFFKDI